MAISNMGFLYPRLEFVGVEILTTFCFLWHNFGSRYARKPIKGFKDSDDSVVSKTNFRKNIDRLDWRPGPDKVGHKKGKTFVT